MPDSFLENWEFGGRKSHFSDRFSGYSVFVSRSNPDFETSLLFAELIGKQMKAQGLQYAQQYTQAIMAKCFAGLSTAVFRLSFATSSQIAPLQNDSWPDDLGHLPPEHPPRILV